MSRARAFRPFAEAREFVRSLLFQNTKQLQLYSNSTPSPLRNRTTSQIIHSWFFGLSFKEWVTGQAKTAALLAAVFGYYNFTCCYKISWNNGLKPADVRLTILIRYVLFFPAFDLIDNILAMLLSEEPTSIFKMALAAKQVFNCR